MRARAVRTLSGALSGSEADDRRVSAALRAAELARGRRGDHGLTHTRMCARVSNTGRVSQIWGCRVGLGHELPPLLTW